MTASKPVTRSLVADDLDQWVVLFRQYAEFYQFPVTAESIAATWSWIMDPDHPVEGICVCIDDRLQGIAHFRAMPNPLRGRYTGFLDDLFVDPDERGTGRADALLEHVTRIGAERNWIAIRWLTRDDNYRARAFYDKVAELTDWRLYEIIP